MQVTGISNRGLLVIGLLVALLWSLIFAERSITQQARRDYYKFLESRPTDPAKHKPQPSHFPAPGETAASDATLG